MLSEGDDRLDTLTAETEQEATGRFETMFGRPSSDVRTGADMRYVGQSHELEVADGGDWETLMDRFHRAHERRFGFDRPGEPVEVVNLRATASGEPPLTWDELPALQTNMEPVGVGGVWQRSTLAAGFSLVGPAVVVEDNSATLIEAGDRMTVLADGTLEIVT